MTKTVAALFIAIALAAVAPRAEAATASPLLGVPLAETPEATFSGDSFFDLNPFPPVPAPPLFSVSASSAAGLPSSGSLDLLVNGGLDVTLGLTVTESTQGGPVSFLIADTLLDFAALTRTGVNNDRIELLFGGVTGPASAAFGPRVLLALVGEFGPDPLGAGFGSALGGGVAIEATLSSVVPLPGSAWMMIAAAGAVVLIGRRRR